MKYDLYFHRLNKDGNSHQKRLQNKREKLFERQLLKSIYRVEFDLEGHALVGELTPYRQNETKALKYLLTTRDIDLPNGTIISPVRVDRYNQPVSAHDTKGIVSAPVDENDNTLSSFKYENQAWMVFWKEDQDESGYNRYVMLRMTHFLEWVDRDGIARSSYAYFYGQENNMLKDELKSRSRDHTLYTENLKLSFYILPRTPYIRKDDYFEVGEGDFKEAYVVTGFDRQSTPGVEFVSVDPQPIRDNSPAPTPPPKEEEPSAPGTSEEHSDDDDYFWLGGGD